MFAYLITTQFFKSFISHRAVFKVQSVQILLHCSNQIKLDFLTSTSILFYRIMGEQLIKNSGPRLKNEQGGY